MKKIQKWESQFIIVALGQAISMLGSHGVQFALIWWLAEKTSSPFILGISGIVAYISSVTMPIGLLFSSPIAEKVGVNVWFFISGLCMIALTTLVMIRFAAKHRRQETGVPH